MPSKLDPETTENIDMDVDPHPFHKLPKVQTFAEVDSNFELLQATMFDVIAHHAHHTNTTITKLADETRQNFDKLVADMKSILSSQTMMVTICIVFIGFITITVKEIFEMIKFFISFSQS